MWAFKEPKDYGRRRRIQGCEEKEKRTTNFGQSYESDRIIGIGLASLYQGACHFCNFAGTCPKVVIYGSSTQ